MAEIRPEDAFVWEGSPLSSPATDPTPAARPRGRPTWLASTAVVGVAAAIAAGVLLLVGGGGSTALAQAASTTSGAAGFQYTLTMDVGAAGEDVTASGSGEFNRTPLSGSMNLSFDGTQVHELLVPPYVYLQTPSGGSGWTRVSIPSGTAGLSGSSANPDPSSLIKMLSSVGSVTSVGAATVGAGTPDAVAVTEYHAVLDVSKLAAVVPAADRDTFVNGVSQLGVTQIPVDAAVDAQGRLRQFALTLTGDGAAGAMHLSVAMTITRYGPQTPVSAPTSGVADGGSASSSSTAPLAD